MNPWILRPEFDKSPDRPKISVKILNLDAEGNESELEIMMLERERSPEAWETEGLLEDLIQDQIEKGRRGLILDLEALEKADSSDIGEIVAAFQLSTQSGGKLVLANLRPRISEIFRRTELDRTIPVYKSTAEAVSHFGS